MPQSKSTPKSGKKNGKKSGKKRGRKPKKIENIIPVQPNLDSHVLHIPLTTQDLKHIISDNKLNYDPHVPIEPKPYDPDNNFVKIKNNTSSISPVLENYIIIQDSKEMNTDPNTYHEKSDLIKKLDSYIDDNDKYIKKNLKTILFEFIDGNNRNKWPLSVKINCLWCCHTFRNIPIGIPEKYVKNKFYVYGNFCSFNCAAAHIFDSNTASIEKWEKYSLLNLLFKNLLNDDNLPKITLAPPKETLKIFGGFYIIEEFRAATSIERRTFNIVNPPMISIVPKIEENIMNYSLKEEDSFIPLNKELIKRAGASLKLKRKNSSRKNTLKNYMNLKIL